MTIPTRPAILSDLEPGAGSLQDARRWCAARCNHYENFSLASFLFPARLKPGLQGIYAFSRFSDDLADSPPPGHEDQDSTEQRRQRLEHWRSLVADLPKSAALHPILLVLAEDMPAYGYPREELLALLDAFLRDQEPQPFIDDTELQAYCRGSAAPVGRLLLALNGITPDRREDFAELTALSDRVCTGLQLANFWQDVSRDLPVRRLYVPIRRLADHGLPQDPEQLLLARAEFRPLLNDLLDWAEAELNAGEELAARLPFRFGLDVRLFMGGGLAICRSVRELGEAVLWQRPHVDRRAKRTIALRGLIESLRLRRAAS